MEKEEKKNNTDEKGSAEDEVPPALVLETIIIIGEKRGEEPPQPVKEKTKRNWLMIGLALVLIGLSVWVIVNSQYDQNVQSQLAGTYTMSKGINIKSDYFETPIDKNYNLRTTIMSADKDNILVIMSLSPQSANSSKPFESYSIRDLVLTGKETKRLRINERVVSGISVLAVFNASVVEMGHTLGLQIEINRNNASSNSVSPFFYNIDILRTSDGGVYYVKGEDKGIQQEPGFEGIPAIAAIMAIVIIAKRKKE